MTQEVKEAQVPLLTAELAASLDFDNPSDAVWSALRAIADGRAVVVPLGDRRVVNEGAPGGLSIAETLEVLRDHNAWRRSDDDCPMTDPRILGLALDAAIEALSRMPDAVNEAAERDALSTAGQPQQAVDSGAVSNGDTGEAEGLSTTSGSAPSAPVGVDGLLQRIDAAIERVTTGRAAMRIPADPTDPDLVLADARNWIKQAALAQKPAAEAQPVAKLVLKRDGLVRFIRPTGLGLDLPAGEYPLHLGQQPAPVAPVGVE